MLNTHEFAKLTHESCNNYRFEDSIREVNSVWVTVRNIAVLIEVTDEGVVVDLYKDGHEFDTPILAGTRLSFSEAEGIKNAEHT